MLYTYPCIHTGILRIWKYYGPSCRVLVRNLPSRIWFLIPDTSNQNIYKNSTKTSTFNLISQRLMKCPGIYFLSKFDFEVQENRIWLYLDQIFLRVRSISDWMDPNSTTLQTEVESYTCCKIFVPVFWSRNVLVRIRFRIFRSGSESNSFLFC